MEFNESSNNFGIDDDYIIPDLSGPLVPDIQPIQIVTLICYGLVFLLGVPGNALVVWVTGFRMPRTVTSIWFLNLSLVDLLCCLSLPILMVPLAHDDHWHFGATACTLVKGLFNLVMYCSVLLLVVISFDRWMLVKRPIWCQNHRRPQLATWTCVGVWLVALLGTTPEFVFTRHVVHLAKKECSINYTPLMITFRLLLGFIFPFLAIVISHWMVYQAATRRMSGGGGTRSKRTLKVIIAVVVSFFLCWLPLHILDFIGLFTPRSSPHAPKTYLAQNIALCLAYLNSCLNPLLYVCLGRGFKENMTRSLRSVFEGEDQMSRRQTCNIANSTNGKQITVI